MMNYLKNTIAKELKIDANNICIREYKKNNGTIKTGMSVLSGEHVTPIMYIDEVIENIRARIISPEQAATEIAEMYRQSRMQFQGASAYFDKEYILDNSFIQLINVEKNADLLTEVPHAEMCDLAGVIRVKAGEGSYMVKNHMCSELSLSSEMLLNRAILNTKDNGGFCLAKVSAILAELQGMSEDDFPDIPLWSVSSRNLPYGASSMMYPELFEEYAKKIGNDLYILPSSIYEVLLVPANAIEHDSDGALRDIVGSVNADPDIVRKEDFLSNNIYFYKRGSFRIESAEAPLM